MYRPQEESVITNIIREIAKECAEKGHDVSETLVAFVVKAVVLDPQNLFNVDRTLAQQDVRTLVELCVDKLMDQDNPALNTIKMQVYFGMNYSSRCEFLKEDQLVSQSRLTPLSREITDSRVRTQKDLDDLYRQIVNYVLQRSPFSSRTDMNTIREVTSALQTVFPRSELGTFMTIPKKDKEQQLSELSMVVTGILLFNKDMEKGGEAIDDLPAILNETIPAISNDIEKELELSQSLSWQYTALLERLMDPEAETRECVVPLNLLKQALYNVRQHEAFLKVLLADVILCAKQVVSMQMELAKSMKLLRATVHSKTAVHTAHVFPHFTALAKYWSGFQDEWLLLNILRDMLVKLQPFLTVQSQLFPHGQLEDLLEGVEVQTDEQRMRVSSENRVDPVENKTHKWLLPETTANFDKLPLQYKGICGYTLVKKDGLLLPGNPRIGVLKHREKYYAFTSKDAALEFAPKADEYIANMVEKAKCSPELIQLLELHEQFASVTPYSRVPSGERVLVKAVTKCDSSTQTDTHPLETNIVKSYEWNEWELRRKAIKLANLRRKVTHSTQTNLSHFKRDNVTQIYLPKDGACQTRKDTQSNVPKYTWMTFEEDLRLYT